MRLSEFAISTRFRNSLKTLSAFLRRTAGAAVAEARASPFVVVRKKILRPCVVFSMKLFFTNSLSSALARLRETSSDAAAYEAVHSQSGDFFRKSLTCIASMPAMRSVDLMRIGGQLNVRHERRPKCVALLASARWRGYAPSASRKNATDCFRSDAAPCPTARQNATVLRPPYFSLM